MEHPDMELYDVEALATINVTLMFNTFQDSTE